MGKTVRVINTSPGEDNKNLDLVKKNQKKTEPPGSTKLIPKIAHEPLPKSIYPGEELENLRKGNWEVPYLL